jgi:hypothetical protein
MGGAVDDGRAANPGAAGWHPDPYGRHEQRHWNGVAWTSLVADARQLGVDEEPVSGAAAGERRDVLVPDSPGHSDRVRSVARAQRVMLLCYLVNLVGNVAILGTRADLGPFAAPLALASAFFCIWCVYRLCKALEVGTALWVFSMCVMIIPVISFIVLALLNRDATKFLKKNGVKVGLLGSWD